MDGRMCGWAIDRCVGRLNVCMAGCTDKRVTKWMMNKCTQTLSKSNPLNKNVSLTNYISVFFFF